MLLRPIYLLAVLFPLLFPAMSPAAAIDQIREDFQSVTGYVIMPVEEDYLIDLDAPEGVKAGDLIAVIQEGEKITHPVTKEVLGTLDEVKGILQVTRIKEGYSYARPVGKTSDNIARGDTVRRYANMPATFWDYTGEGEDFYLELQSALPELDWPDYETAQAHRPENPDQAGPTDAKLFFLLTADGLQVRGPDFLALKTYQFPADSQTSPTSGDVTALPPPSPSPGAQAPVSWDTRSDGREGNVLNFPEFLTLGALPPGTAMADFAYTGEQLLLATTDGKEFRVFEVGNKLKKVASGDTTLPGKILSVHWWRPEPGGPLYLTATHSVELNQPGGNYVGHKPAGSVFRLENGRLVPVREGLNFILGSFDRDGDGQNETLLGQEFDRDIFFGEVKELRLVGEKIEAQDVPYTLPRMFAVQGSIFADLTGDGSLETATVRNQVLYIHSGDELMYESRQQVGGSVSQMEYYVNPGLKEGDLSTQSFEVPPVARDLDGDGVLELGVIASEGKLLTMPGIGPGVKKAWLAAFKYREGMFVKGTIGEKIDMPLQGLYLTNDMAYLVATEPSSLLGKRGSSHLLAFPLK